MAEAIGSQSLTEIKQFVLTGLSPKLNLLLRPSSRLEMKRDIGPLCLGIGYIFLIYVLGGLRTDHVVIGSLALLDYYNFTTRLFLRRFFPFILTGIVFDSMRYFYWQGIAGHVHVREPYLRDLSWFGVSHPLDPQLGRVTPNEYFQLRPTVWLDFLCGLAYLVFVAEYLLTAFYLFAKGSLRLLHFFGWCFFSVNLMGYLTYFIYPAAPPWYVTAYGFGPARMDIHPEAAAAQRFDQIFGTHFFKEMYLRGVDVYGAYPSLHVAYPLLVVWICMINPKLKWCRAPAISFYLLMCLSAVYLQHHYVVDIILGSVYALIVATVATILMRRKPVIGQTTPAIG